MAGLIHTTNPNVNQVNVVYVPLGTHSWASLQAAQDEASKMITSQEDKDGVVAAAREPERYVLAGNDRQLYPWSELEAVTISRRQESRASWSTTTILLFIAAIAIT